MQGTTPHYLAPTGGASFAPSAVLTPRTPSSYAIALGNADMIAADLARQGWRRLPGNSVHEVARMRGAGRGLIVLYEQSVLVQGDTTAGHAALRGLVEVRP